MGCRSGPNSIQRGTVNDHPPPSEWVAGFLDAPPVVSPITVTLGNVRMAATKLSVALKPPRPVINTTGRKYCQGPRGATVRAVGTSRSSYRGPLRTCTYDAAKLRAVNRDANARAFASLPPPFVRTSMINPGASRTRASIKSSVDASPETFQ